MNTEGHYEVREVEFGRIYRWCPESVSVGCNCGERLIFNLSLLTDFCNCGERLSLTSSMTTCYRCEADQTAVVWEELSARRSGDDEVLHPWRYARDRGVADIPFQKVSALSRGGDNESGFTSI